MAGRRVQLGLASLVLLAGLAGCQELMATADPTIHVGETVSLSCSDCHTPDYEQTTSPAHKASGYPTTCESCHTKAAWIPATGGGKHDFPIDSGQHKGIPCATCHTQPGNNAVFTCMSSGCHPKGQTDGDHVGEVSGYSYDAKACYGCHPDGKE